MSSTAAPWSCKPQATRPTWRTLQPLGMALCASLLSLPSQADSLAFCQGQAEPSAAVQDRLIQVAGVAKAMLEQSGQRLAIVARSGLALQRLDQRYSHAGISLRHSPNTPWSVRQLYFACDEQRPRIFDQGMSGFVLGVHDAEVGFLSLLLLPEGPAQALEAQALDTAQALRLLHPHYSANAYAFSTRYQNCNQWLAEMLASAWQHSDAHTPSPFDARTQAQQWLHAAQYQPTAIQLGWRPLVWLTSLLPWLHRDDHPEADLAQAQFRVSMPASIARFVRQREASTQHVELCYTARYVVVRQGWEPLSAACEPGLADQVIALHAPAHSP